jgi:biotin synthase
MTTPMLSLIDLAKKDALAGRIMEKETFLTLLSLSPTSPECDYLRKTAGEVAHQITQGTAYLWGALGLDFKACPMNCDFCSLGKNWGLVQEEKEFSMEEILSQVRSYVKEGVRWIVLRTTEFYQPQTLIQLAKTIRKECPGEYELGFNIGEFTLEQAQSFHEAGLQFIYHSLRLREGQNTHFDPQQRLETLQSVADSPLDLVYLVEPIGIEHTNEEIYEIFTTILRYGAKVSGAMARVPVKGTPLGHLPMLDQQRLSQIIAVLRLACGTQIPDICVHPPSPSAIASGANVVVVEAGAIPRDSKPSASPWQQFTPQVAKKWFQENGYTVSHKEVTNHG